MLKQVKCTVVFYTALPTRGRMEYGATGGLTVGQAKSAPINGGTTVGAIVGQFKTGTVNHGTTIATTSPHQPYKTLAVLL